MSEINQSGISIWVALVIGIISLGLYFFMISYIDKRKKKNESNESEIYLKRGIGVITFGFFPLITSLFFPVSVVEDFGLVFPQPVASGIWLLVLILFIIPLGIYWAKTPGNLGMYPQIRSSNWTPRLYAWSALTWAAYLLAYEFFFRGFLLFTFYYALGAMPAVIINVIIYSLAHLPKGKVETVGAIPYGVILCIVTLSTGSIWAAFGAHVVMALTNEWASIYYHKKLKGAA
ncbi:MAG TPA: type II CAAX endopeptidase family protein [Sunxiuqinia sp.]|nr:type II CAAX endopeptidase family protein [Sunxiuqinia sp.]